MMRVRFARVLVVTAVVAVVSFGGGFVLWNTPGPPPVAVLATVAFAAVVGLAAYGVCRRTGLTPPSR